VSGFLVTRHTKKDPSERLPTASFRRGFIRAGTKGHKAISNLHLLHFIHRLCQLMSEAISFSFLFSFLYGIKLYFMKHVVKGGILAFVVICLYAFVTVIASAL
jgi:hypothetical protein